MAHHDILQVANTVTIDRQQLHKNTFRWRARDGDVQLRWELVADFQVAYMQINLAMPSDQFYCRCLHCPANENRGMWNQKDAAITRHQVLPRARPDGDLFLSNRYAWNFAEGGHNTGKFWSFSSSIPAPSCKQQWGVQRKTWRLTCQGSAQAALPQGIVPFVFAKEYNVHADILSTAWVLYILLLILAMRVVKELTEICLVRQDNSGNDGCGSGGPGLLLRHGSSQTLTMSHLRKGLSSRFILRACLWYYIFVEAVYIWIRASWPKLMITTSLVSVNCSASTWLVNNWCKRRKKGTPDFFKVFFFLKEYSQINF